ncbi:NAD(P)-dependent oxidoreductase [Kalamiella sp. sgz302252]|uniref:NAD(P)-dependent oxidoreductase n=1 Tax=Pantoea sp. sgz302252 TaxID=3341827 RepID=UPI0036D3ED67
MNQRPAVAVLGLGAMGHAFAANLLKKDLVVSGWNRTKSRGEDLQQAGLRLADTPQQAVEQADVVISMLANAEITQEVLSKALSSFKQGAILVQMGTIGVEATEKLLTTMAKERPDVIVLDAPVSGTKAPAENAQILVLASGDREKAQAAEPVFAAISKGVKWLGEAGAASRMKLVVNAWLISMVQGLAESTQMAEEFGFTPDQFWDVLDGGPLAAPYAKAKLGMIEEGSYEPQMQLTWALKDARLALAAAKESRLPGLNVTAKLWQEAVDAGYGDKDLSVIYRYLQENK